MKYLILLLPLLYGCRDHDDCSIAYTSSGAVIVSGGGGGSVGGTAVVPEPSTWALLALGIVFIILSMRLRFYK